jgi:hypothetical protein
MVYHFNIYTYINNGFIIVHCRAYVFNSFMHRNVFHIFYQECCSVQMYRAEENWNILLHGCINVSDTESSCRLIHTTVKSVPKGI